MVPNQQQCLGCLSHSHITWSHPGLYNIGAVLQESMLIWADPTSYLIPPSWQQEPCSNLGCVGGPIQRDKMCPAILSIRHPHNKWLSTWRCIADLFLQKMYGLLNILGQWKEVSSPAHLLEFTCSMQGVCVK